MTKLDEVDLKLIYLLRDNSRLSISELAELLGVSRPTVRSRIERLEREGIIRKYTIQIAPELERAENLVLMIIKTENPEKLEEFNEIIEINKFTSKKYVIKVAVENMEQLRQVIEGAGFEVIDIMPVLEMKERERAIKIRVPFKCDYCGREITEEPIVYKYRNKVYFFCCETCFREFKKTRENLEKIRLSKEQKVENTNNHQDHSHG
ncbi:AsnC family transcriptional regulator [Thermococcus litoralis DSM 5473]|uniref:AsnC family transcriptional regulator n=1 Tax=Thermococcus litoralis (strain ATCC 51850 / DSM 5473 / JCM 8560 / NS-C) TaxID=523849 RepID=H3ZMU1_THELN|nr:TRASH domain-containing protein [Thermococcus litoralis]EHR78738.1 AsnC family transcriptional regulator [Thermococcus litoralis DSM 5473]